MTGQVVVFGSANIDLVVPVAHHPVPGETVLGGTLSRHPGGKGANQAVAAARAGRARTAFIGMLGPDEHAQILRRSLTEAGVDIDGVGHSQTPTGTALITVSAEGENTIVVAPGANHALGPPDARAAERIARADVLLAQLEVPLPAIAAAAQALSSDALFVLNAAPPQPLPAELRDVVDVLVVNEHEALALAQHVTDPGRAEAGTALAETDPTPRETARAPSETDPIRAAQSLTARSSAGRATTVVLTRGAQGCVIAREGREPVSVPAPQVEAVDTTGAGDTFCGVLAAGLAQGLTIETAAERAVTAGALAVTRQGAQEAVPSAQDVDRHLAGGQR